MSDRPTPVDRHRAGSAKTSPVVFLPAGHASSPRCAFQRTRHLVGLCPVLERRATTAQTAAVSMHERPHDPCRGDSRSGTSYGEPTSQRRGPERPIGFCRTQPPRHATVVKRDGVGFHSDCIAPPRHMRRSAHRQSGQHGGVNPNLRAHSPQTSNPPDPVYAFAQATGPRHQNLLTAKTGPFSIPLPGI